MFAIFRKAKRSDSDRPFENRINGHSSLTISQLRAQRDSEIAGVELDFRNGYINILEYDDLMDHIDSYEAYSVLD